MPKSMPATYLCILSFILVACGASAPEATATNEPTRTLPATFTPIVITATLAETNTPGPTNTPQPAQSIEAVIDAVALNLRSGPGTVHAIVGALVEDDTVTAEGRAPGNEWVKVRTSEDQIGWLSLDFIRRSGEVEDLALLDISESFVVQGVVVDNSGAPVDNISIALIQDGADGPLRTDTTSGEDGSFFAYLPPESFGNWAVQIVGAGCDSRIMNADCQMVDYFSVNNTELITLPPPDELVFLYSAATVKITGTVVNLAGEPVDGIRVIAVREDLAFTFGETNELGEFSLAASEGDWDVLARDFATGRDSELVNVIISGAQAPEPVIIVAP
ncbi:MAG: hypothetical protein DWQ07_01165 [Chloroflexi bacterium]|nr:MAG: hypothetical protein DWQ07_01165 [Chloroflexota bacterium]